MATTTASKSVAPRTKAQQAQEEAKEQRDRDQERLLQVLGEAAGKMINEDDVKFVGKEIILPAGTTLVDNIDFLQKKMASDEQKMDFRREFKYRPFDGARATMMALKKTFGMVRQQSTWHWWGEEPPSLITIPVGVDESEQVPWGAMGVPLLPGVVIMLGSIHNRELGQLFIITARGPRKYRFQVEGLFNVVEHELKTNSLYLGAAIDGQEKPQFLDLSGVDETKVIYATEVERQLEANLWQYLRNRQTMKENGRPLKRAVLLAGPFGVGKTLGAMLTAQIGHNHGWTVIYCRPGRDDLVTVMATARLYQPALVLFEDIDNVSNTDASQGVDHVSKIMDVFDGIQSKNTEIVVVLTTNHVHRIHKAMMRPGRLDALVEFGAVDHQAVKRLAISNLPAATLDPAKIDWEKVGNAMNGFMAAFVVEGLNRAFGNSMARNGGVPGEITTDDLVTAAGGLLRQQDLMNGAGELKPPDTLSSVMANIVAAQVDGAKVVDEDDDERFTIKIDGNGSLIHS